MKLIAYQKGDDRIMARVLDQKALPVAKFEDFWANPQQNLLAAAQMRSGGESLATLIQVPPLPDTARILCAGMNYLSHAQEAQLKVPEQPDIFARWRSTLSVDGQSIPIPPRDDHFDWEGELAVVVGTELRDVTPEVAKAGILGYDVSTTSAPASFKWPPSAGHLARTPTAQGLSDRGLLRPTKSRIPIDCESRPGSTATLFKIATRQTSSFQAPKSQPMLQGQ